jgi:coenzyme PQQ precursor peptide PqqA
MTWKTPRIVELPVGMEINMYACATHRPHTIERRPKCRKHRNSL